MTTEMHCHRQTDCSSCPHAGTSRAFVYRHFAKGQHLPAEKCTQNWILCLIKGQLLVNSEEYPGTNLREGDLILQAIGSKLELLALSDADVVICTFNELSTFCESYYKEILDQAFAPLTYTPLRALPPLARFLEGLLEYLKEEGPACASYLDLKAQELAFLLISYYPIQQLHTFFYPISVYTESFHYFVMQNYEKVKNVEEFAHLGGYTTTTFRRLFKNMYGVPVYEWMLAKKREGILDDLRFSKMRISDICARYGFESLSHFAHFCKDSFGDTPRSLRKRAANGEKITILKKGG